MWKENVDANWKVEFDRFMVFAGLISPLATIPQIVKLYATHTELAAGQSLTTWALYTIIAALWAVYGIINRQLAVLVGNALGTLIYAIVAIGIVIHAGWTF
ncbi:MAG: SemiSWEET transporter [Rhizobiales bacterium]|nr:SemiSWEET transporter [Hyphomicrobiales bacterium]